MNPITEMLSRCDAHAGGERIIGWDVGGAHLKACLLEDGAVRDVAEWACPLWQGIAQLDLALHQALARWPEDMKGVPAATVAHGHASPDARAQTSECQKSQPQNDPPQDFRSKHSPSPGTRPTTRHAVTMTGEMADCFDHRQHGVKSIAEHMAARLGPEVYCFAGQSGWCNADQAMKHWQHVASANWLATAMHAARVLGDGVLVDIGSTTTDFIAFTGGLANTRSLSDSQRLASGELVYHGVVRTPLCAVAPRIRWRDTRFNVMNELFATTADVYRLTGELNPAHDLHPSADNGPKDLPGSRRRLARMVGLDARDGTDEDWHVFALAWREAQLSELAGQLQRVLDAAGLRSDLPIVSAGCGDFLAHALARKLGRPVLAYGAQVAHIAPGASPGVSAWAQVCAPSVAVASLLHALSSGHAVNGADPRDLVVLSPQSSPCLHQAPVGANRGLVP